MRVVVVDDHELIRRGLRLLLQTTDEIDVVGEAGTGLEALAVVRRVQPDLVLADALMPDLDGIELTSRLAELTSAPPVIILTTFDGGDLVRRAIGAGAAGFLLKGTSTDELLAAMHAVVQGGLVIDPRVAHAVVHRRSTTGPADAAEPDPALALLTRAELHVARLVATGSTNAEIATELTLAHGTVKNHISSLLRKLDQRDRTALALMLHRLLD